MRRAHLVAIVAVLGLAACSERDITLHDLRTNSGQPEEFSIVPNKPLQTPESYSALPAPTPGGANRTDQTPLKDAVAALGGNPARLDPERMDYVALNPEYIADAIIHAIDQPKGVSIGDITVRASGDHYIL